MLLSHKLRDAVFIDPAKDTYIYVKKYTCKRLSAILPLLPVIYTKIFWFCYKNFTMAKVDQPIFILPKKRNGKKQNNVVSHVDHIISVQVSICTVIYVCKINFRTDMYLSRMRSNTINVMMIKLSWVVLPTPASFWSVKTISRLSGGSVLSTNVSPKHRLFYRLFSIAWYNKCTCSRKGGPKTIRFSARYSLLLQAWTSNVL